MLAMIVFGHTFEISCESCGDKAPHNVTCAGKEICHFHCSACRAVNAYLVGPAGEKKVGKHQDHAALMERKGKQDQVYSASTTFTDGQYFKHPKFGRGYVLAVASPPTKMEVLFEDQKRVLVCGPDSISGAKIASARKRKAVFKDDDSVATPADDKKDDDSVATPANDKKKPMECPICKKMVHPYNLSEAPNGKVVGCMYCR